jgi:hypothetical protein
MRRSSPSRVLRLALVSCAILLGGLVSGTQALAAGGEAPSIEGLSATTITEHGATLEATIDPEGLATTYAFWLGHEVCRAPVVGYEKHCYISVTGPLSEGHIAAGAAGEVVGAMVTGLEADTPYVYTVAAVSSAGHVLGAEKQFRTLTAGGMKTEGTPPLPPPENTPTPFERPAEPWIGSRAAEGAERQLASAEAERKEREATSPQPAAVTPPQGDWCGEEGCGGGEVVLAGTSIAVQSDGMALVTLSCTGNEDCSGELTFSARMTSTVKGGKRRSRMVKIATAKFVIVAGKTATVKVKLGFAGRNLLSAAHGRIVVSLKILESGSGLEYTHTANVHLTQRTYRGKARK